MGARLATRKQRLDAVHFKVSIFMVMEVGDHGSPPNAVLLLIKVAKALENCKMSDWIQYKHHTL